MKPLKALYFFIILPKQFRKSIFRPKNIYLMKGRGQGGVKYFLHYIYNMFYCFDFWVPSSGWIYKTIYSGS